MQFGLVVTSKSPLFLAGAFFIIRINYFVQYNRKKLTKSDGKEMKIICRLKSKNQHRSKIKCYICVSKSLHFLKRNIVSIICNYGVSIRSEQQTIKEYDCQHCCANCAKTGISEVAQFRLITIRATSKRNDLEGAS